MRIEEAMERITELEEQLELQQLMSDISFEAIGVFDEDLRCLMVNKVVKEVLGYEPDDAMGMTLTEVLAPEYHGRVVENVRKNVQEPYYAKASHKDGTVFPVEVRGETHFINGQKYRIAALRDTSYQEETIADMLASLEEMEIIFANTRVGLVYLHGGRLTKRVNQKTAALLGYDSPDEMKGLDVRDVHLSQKNFEEFGERYFAKLADGEQLQIEYQLRRKDGTPIWCTLSGKAVDRNKPADVNKGVLWVIDDITERKKKELELVQLATTDDLTGALTRREFARKIEEMLSGDNRCSSGPSLLMLDLDHFKSINDKYGHQAGDIVLQEFATICGEQMREFDLFSRMGGEEFAIFLPSTGLRGAIALAERIRKRVAAFPIIVGRKKIRLTVSIGISGVYSKALRLGELFRRADKSLYQAKTEGRNRVSFYD